MAKVDKEDAAFVTGLVAEFGLMTGMPAVNVERQGWELCRIARALHRCNARECNEDMDDPTRRRFEARVAGLEVKASVIAGTLGCPLELNGDPRGISLILTLPSGRTNDWGQRGWCV